jgi:1-acyl-sn-glycerol-3-phosphate acyltransferase
MLHFLPGMLIGIISFLLLVINTCFWGGIILPFGLLKLLPTTDLRAACTRVVVACSECWVDCNGLIFSLTQKLEWDFEDSGGMRKDGWYLVICNHRSWSDIPIIQKVYNRRVPFFRFFIKQQLIYVPVLGFVWWALDFPFMKRYSKEELARRPELKGKDLETTRRICELFKRAPTSVLNYLEGTRFTPAKHARQQSPYRHLLLPKAGGMASVLAAMGDRLDAILDITVVYYDKQIGFWDLLCGRIRRVSVRARVLDVPAHLRGRDYATDAEFREQIQQWINERWVEKDELIESLVQTDKPAAAMMRQ